MVGMRVWRMRTGITFIVSAADRERVTARINDRNAPQKRVWRARIILLSGDGVGTVEIMRRTGKAKTCVWRWQERFAEEGFGGGCCTARRGRRALRPWHRKCPSAWWR